MEFPGSTPGAAVPDEVLALVRGAGVAERIAEWCPASLRAGAPKGFAVAVASAGGGGRYAVVDADGTFTPLAPFTGGADLKCYGRRDAERLDASIKASATITGSVTPQWDTTVICGFVNDTEAVCWQFAARQHAFVRVGGWVT